MSGANRNTDCGAVVPALPFDPPHRDDFDTTVGVPPAFVGTHHYYYLSRFAFAFYMVALVFAVLALLTSALALCTRLGAYMAAVNAALAALFQAVAASLVTAWVVEGRDGWRKAGQVAGVGEKALGFTWAAAVCFFVSTVLFCVGGSTARERGYTGQRRSGLFGRKRSTRSRGSFIGSDRGIKDDYA